MINLSNLNSVLYLSPYVTSLLGAIYIYLRLNFYSVKNFLTKFESGAGKINSYDHAPLVNFLTISLTLVIIVTNSNNMVNPAFNNSPVAILLLLSYSYLLNNHNNHNNHWLFGSFFSIIFSLLLLGGNSVFNFLFLLEINTYLFLYLSICQVQSISTSQSKSVLNATLVAFIINFFSSIFIFSVVLYLLYLNGSTIFACDGVAASAFFFFFVLKLLSGPWVYFGVEVYKGFKYLTLLVYNLIFILVLIPKMFFFMVSFSLSVQPWVFAPIFLYTVAVLISIRAINSLKIFLAYSTSFNFIYVLLFYFVVRHGTS